MPPVGEHPRDEERDLQVPPIDMDALLFMAMGDPAILSPALAGTIERMLGDAASGQGAPDAELSLCDKGHGREPMA